MKDHVVLITGASSGIGEAAARELVRRGAKVVLCARRTDLLESVAASLRAAGGSAIAFACDVTKDGDCEAAVARAVAEWGRLDVLLANAGFAVAGRVEALSIDDYRRQLETNFFGAVRAVKAALPELKRTKGRIGVVGSVNGFIGTPATSAYCASKFAVEALSDTLRLELKGTGIHVALIEPGPIRTRFVETALRHFRAAIDVEARITGNFFYRDGNWICSVDGDGTAVRQVISGGMEPEVSPDGSKLAYQNANGISICNSDGSNPELITGAGCFNPTWSPDGLYLAYQDDAAAAIKFMRLHDRTESTITIPNGNNPTWSRQGRLCYQSAGQLFLADFTIDSLFVTPTAPTISPLTFTGAGTSAGLVPADPTWSADGATLAFTYRSDTIYTCDVSAPDPVERYHAPGRTVDRAWLMPGGPVTRVAFGDRTPAGVGSIKLANIDLSGTALVSGVIDLIPGTKLKGRTSWGP